MSHYALSILFAYTKYAMNENIKDISTTSIKFIHESVTWARVMCTVCFICDYKYSSLPYTIRTHLPEGGGGVRLYPYPLDPLTTT